MLIFSLRQPGKRQYLVAILVFLSGCHHHFSAIQPPQVVVQPPPVAASHVGITISAPTTLLQTAANNAIPALIEVTPYNMSINGGADNCGSGASLGYHVERTPITITGNANTLTATAELDYRIEGRARTPCILGAGPLISGSCGTGNEWPRRLRLAISANFNGIGPNWDPQIGFSLGALTPLNECQVTLVSLDVTSRVVQAVSGAISAALPNLNQSLITAASLHDHAERGWNLLLQPIQIGPSTWLTIHPRQIGVFPFTASPESVVSGLQIVAQPDVILSNAMPVADSTTLPAPSAVTASNAFFFELPTAASYSFIDAQLKHALKLNAGGIRYPPTGSLYVKVVGASVYAYGPKAVLRLDVLVSGAFGPKATVYLVGTPTYNSVNSTLTFPDADFTLESNNLLVRIAAWLKQADLRDDLRTRARLDLSAQASDIKSKFLAALNKQMGAVALKGTVDTLELLGVYSSPTDGTFKAIFQSAGTLQITVN